MVFPRDAAEQEPVLVSWVMYLDSLGIKPLTPLMGVILSMCLYFLPRLTHMIEAAKEKFKKKPSAANRGEPEPMKSAAPGPEKTPGPKQNRHNRRQRRPQQTNQREQYPHSHRLTDYERSFGFKFSVHD